MKKYLVGLALVLLTALLVGCSHCERKTVPDGSLIMHVNCEEADNPAEYAALVKESCEEACYSVYTDEYGRISCY